MNEPPVQAETINEFVTAAIAYTAEAIARMAEERSRRWVADGVRLAAGQGNPFPVFAAEIRARFGSEKK